MVESTARNSCYVKTSGCTCILKARQATKNLSQNKHEQMNEQETVDKGLVVYSDPIDDDDGKYQYRYVLLPDVLQKRVRINDRLDEEEWRKRLCLSMSAGWVHYGFYNGTTTMLFKRKKANFCTSTNS